MAMDGPLNAKPLNCLSCASGGDNGPHQPGLPTYPFQKNRATKVHIQ